MKQAELYGSETALDDFNGGHLVACFIPLEKNPQPNQRVAVHFDGSLLGYGIIDEVEYGTSIVRRLAD